MTPFTSPHFLYVADPMCSWCYGFESQLSEVLSSTNLDLRLVMGGLWAGENVVANDELRSYLDSTWRRVEKLSGQPIDHDALDRLVRDPWVYDTTPACEAVLRLRATHPEHAKTFFSAIQRAFYAHGQDVTQPDVLETIKQDLGLPSVIDLSSSTSLSDDMAVAQRLGATGFPVLFLAMPDDEILFEYVPLATGYTTAAQVKQRLAVFS